MKSSALDALTDMRFCLFLFDLALTANAFSTMKQQYIFWLFEMQAKRKGQLLLEMQQVFTDDTIRTRDAPLKSEHFDENQCSPTLKEIITQMNETIKKMII